MIEPFLRWCPSELFAKLVSEHNSKNSWEGLEKRYGHGSIPIDTIFDGMNIHKSQLF